MKSTTRKAQVEIIGLFIIVIIIILGLVYAFTSRQKDQVDTRQDYLDEHIAQATLDVIVRADTDCSADVLSIIEDCYESDRLCGGSCDYITAKVAEILDGSLGTWGRPYRFYTQKGNDRKIDFNTAGCTAASEKSSSGVYVIPVLHHPADPELAPDNIVVDLEICKT